MDMKWDVKDKKYKNFDVEALLRSNGSFNDFVLSAHLKLLTSTDNKGKVLTLNSY